ncbi:LLM class flavin-dependent oxidoreductase [Lacisediminihabitans sp. H27-G8]|uniref:LLM class flavin-dependent oxidoreductase n=1 Tax=Lacisediminihabitans sp. H27-G8 TaxID=3111909 RepID=UPI0038FBEC01
MSRSSNTLRVGVVARPQLLIEKLAEAANAVEAAGIADLWLWEDSFWSGGVVLATAALSTTSRLRVGLGLMPIPLRNPALAAMEVAALSRLHPQRFVPAFGHGIRTWMDQAGGAVDSPITLMREYVVAVRALLQGEELTTRGRYVKLNGVRLAVPLDRREVPPVLIGANGPKSLMLAGEIADGVLLGDISTPEAAAKAIEFVRQGRARSSLEHQPFSVVGYVEPGADPAAQAEEYAAAGLNTLVFTTWEGDADPRRLLAAAQAAIHAKPRSERGNPS